MMPTAKEEARALFDEKNAVARAVNQLRDEFAELGYRIISVTTARGRRVEASTDTVCAIGTADEVRKLLRQEAARRAKTRMPGHVA